MEAYEKPDCLFWCTSARVSSAVGTRTVRKLIPEKINVCCEGYTEDEQSSGSSIHCKPVCSPPCLNGYCKSPGLCVCDPGYLPDNFDHHTCSPLCIKGCDHGTCVAPNTCKCDLGYDLMNRVCEPVCSDPCHNGSCVAPDTCQCFPGYQKSNNDTCEPYCSSYTASGECINTITCDSGWMKVTKGSVEICEPVCTESCVNSTCVAPETCECMKGYKKSINDFCEPYCSACYHGSCISPETCVCDPGWYKKESNGTCLAHCDFKCGNGTCVAPNVCECFSGYDESYYGEKDAVCVPICDNCEGSCIAPGNCVYESPQESPVSANGGPCDCTDYCSEEANKCEKTICLLTTTTATVTEYDSIENDNVEHDNVEHDRIKDDSIKHDSIEDTTVSMYILSTTEVEYDNIVDSHHSDQNKLKIETASWFRYNWSYVIGSIVLTLIILLVVTILRRKFSKSLNRNLFNAHYHDADVSTAAVHYKQSNCFT